jgi:hypothetical protein
LELNNYVYWRNYVGPRIVNNGATKKFIPSPMVGLPDVIGILKNRPGVLFAIEIKNAVGKLSEKQAEWIRKLEDAGALVIVARELNQVIEVLTGYDKE